jgi:hypothetical protein
MFAEKNKLLSPLSQISKDDLQRFDITLKTRQIQIIFIQIRDWNLK